MESLLLGLGLCSRQHSAHVLSATSSPPGQLGTTGWGWGVAWCECRLFAASAKSECRRCQVRNQKTCNSVEDEDRSWAPSHMEGIHQACLEHADSWSPAHTRASKAFFGQAAAGKIAPRPKLLAASRLVCDSRDDIFSLCFAALGLSGKV